MQISHMPVCLEPLKSCSLKLFFDGRLQEKLKQKRLEREQQEKQEQLQREKARRVTGKDMVAAKAKLVLVAISSWLLQYVLAYISRPKVPT